MLNNRISLFGFFAFILVACTTNNSEPTSFTDASSDVFRYVGRIDKSSAIAPVLASPASYVEFSFDGNTASISLLASTYGSGHTWAAIEVDGQYLGRYRIESKDTFSLVVSAKELQMQAHKVRIHHAAEPLFGRLIFLGASGKLNPTENIGEELIFFFGDSMSCGAASDTTSGPCGYGAHHDNANGYLAFPARVARSLNADFIVHAVSGRGLYTNWNGQDPPLPPLLPHLYLDTANATPYRMADQRPSAAVIALGTNDLNSAPDLRPEFDSLVFAKAGIDFISQLHDWYPDMPILLSTSAMYSNEKGRLLSRTLDRTIIQLREKFPKIRIAKAQLEDMELHGCPAGPHPSVEEHAVIAEQLTAALKKLM